MSVVKALRDYIGKMVKITGGMKVLLLDAETVPLVPLFTDLYRVVLCPWSTPSPKVSFLTNDRLTL